MKGNKVALLVANKEAELEINAEKVKYVSKPC